MAKKRNAVESPCRLFDENYPGILRIIFVLLDKNRDCLNLSFTCKTANAVCHDLLKRGVLPPEGRKRRISLAEAIAVSCAYVTVLFLFMSFLCALFLWFFLFMWA